MIHINQSYYGFFLVILIMLIIFSQSKVYGQDALIPEVAITNTVEVIPKIQTNHLLSKAIFNVNDQAEIIVNPVFNNNSTNIAFYIQCPSQVCTDIGTVAAPQYIFTAENLGHGSLPLTQYWEVPAPTSYVAIEYKNDNQQFSCSSLTLEQCITDTHFIKRYNFEVVASNVSITETMAAAIESENAELPQVSQALLQLSISLSSTSISSNLDNGLIVTASLDGIISLATSSIATETIEMMETNATASSSSFLKNIVETVIELFTDTKIPNVTPTPFPAESSPPFEAAPVTPIIETPQSDTPNSEVPNPTLEITENEITTTTF